MRPYSPFKPGTSLVVPFAPAPPDEILNASSSKGKGKAVFVDVLVEGVEEETSFRVPTAAKSFLAGLGEVLQAAPSRTAEAGPSISSRRETNATALKNIITELLTTERSYVRRIRTLHIAYAVPLKASAKTTGRNPLAITAYEANSLFSNIEKIVSINEAFLQDLEFAVKKDDSTWAEVLRHHLSAFESYNVYVTNYPTAREIERRLSSNATFSRFCENVQYSPTADVGNAGLRDLLAEPFQRIARYPLMINEMLRQLSPTDPMRPNLLQASAAAASIAHNQHDEVARRTEEMISISATISEFPKTLINGHRRFISAIDVKDMPAGQTNALHVTLFLFSDLLVICKRPSGEKGRALAGLERTNSLLSSPFKGLSAGLQYKGAARLCDLVAVDDGASFALHFECPPQEVGVKWSGRATRRYFAETAEKRTFMAQLWNTQAQQHMQPGASTILATSLSQLARSASFLLDRDDAHVYFTIYNRSSYLDESNKGHTALRLDGVGGEYDSLDFVPDKIKPQLIIDATLNGHGFWQIATRKRGAVPEEGRSPLTHAALAFCVAQTVLQNGLADAPPRYSTHGHVTEPFLSVSPGKHRRAHSTASKISSQGTSLRESTASAAFGSNPPLQSEIRSSPKSDEVPPTSVVKGALADFQGEPNLPKHGDSLQPQKPQYGSDRRESLVNEDVFGPTLPLSPRARTPLGPRPSPSQPKRKPAPAVEADFNMEEPLRNVADKSECEITVDASSSAIKRQREEAEVPTSPDSTHIRKRSIVHQRSHANGDYSPNVRSPLGRQSPHKAQSERAISPGGLVSEIDAAIEDAAGRSDSMKDLRKIVNTFVLPDQKGGVSKTAIGRSVIATGRRDSLTRSPKLGQLSAHADEVSAVPAAFESFKHEVNDKLDALLGGWEETTKRYQRLAQAYQNEKVAAASAIATRDEKIEQLQSEVRELKDSHTQLNEEVQEIYTAVNRELDRIFEEARLPNTEAVEALQKEVKRKTADEILLKHKVQQLEARLAVRS